MSGNEIRIDRQAYFVIFFDLYVTMIVQNLGVFS